MVSSAISTTKVAFSESLMVFSSSYQPIEVGNFFINNTVNKAWPYFTAKRASATSSLMNRGLYRPDQAVFDGTNDGSYGRCFQFQQRTTSRRWSKLTIAGPSGQLVTKPKAQVGIIPRQAGYRPSASGSLFRATMVSSAATSVSGWLIVIGCIRIWRHPPGPRLFPHQILAQR